MKIFVVDDDPLARLIALDQIDRRAHEVTELENAEALLEALSVEEPDLILLDIEMPGINGIEACRQLREAGMTHAQVIFISAHDDLDSRLAAYDAGGSDFIVKPFEAQELGKKLRTAEELREAFRALEERANYAQSTAFNVMSSLGEVGVTLQFLRGSFSSQDVASLAHGLLEALRQYDLHGLIEIRLAAGARCFSTHGECSPLEVSILTHAASMDRIFQFRDRLAINYPAVTLLILGLPVSDPDRVGRLRDDLAILIEGADARVRAMEEEQQRLAQANGIKLALGQLTQALAEIEKAQAETRWQMLETQRKYLEQLAGSFVHLGLTDGQEALLARQAQESHEALRSIIEESYSVGDNLRSVVGQLKQLLG
jgi:DNA-binding response OmpR family regulator